MKWVICLVALSGVALTSGCSSSGEEPTENQKTVVPEATGGKPVSKEGDQFTRQSDRN